MLNSAIERKGGGAGGDFSLKEIVRRAAPEFECRRGWLNVKLFNVELVRLQA